MPKLKERQFYNVVTHREEMVPAEYINVVIFRNGAYALKAIGKRNEKLFKLIANSKVASMERKYGKAKRYSKRRH